jgi:PKD repeat protein
MDADKSVTAIFVTTSNGRPPVANAGGPYYGYEGSSIKLSASKSTDPDKNIVSYEWDLDNDGQFDDATGRNPRYTFADNGIYTIRVRVTDAGGSNSVASATATIRNVSPAITSLSVDGLVRVGATVSARATVKDPGVNDTFIATWNWGDGKTSTGTVSGNTVSGSHVYTRLGVYLASVTVKDKDGGTGQAYRLIFIWFRR